MTTPTRTGVRLLIADDDQDLLRGLKSSLEQDGYEVICASNGTDVLRLAFEVQPDLVMLDVMMPEMDGLETCRRLRDVLQIPIVFLTARDSEADIVRGLNYGADDYVAKPFNLAELKARLSAALRRAGNASYTNPLVYDDGVLRVDLRQHLVEKRGKPVPFTPRELQLFACLVQNMGQVVSHADLLKRVWGPEYEQEVGYLALYIRYCRQKLEDDPSRPRYICTRFRVGYYFCVDDQVREEDYGL